MMMVQLRDGVKFKLASAILTLGAGRSSLDLVSVDKDV